MNQTKLADFINCDIKILDIVQIYHHNNTNWKRDYPAKRDYEGLLLFAKGSIHYDFDGFSFDAHEGDVLKLPSGIPYSGIKLGSDDNVYCVIDFITEHKDEFINYPLPLVFHPYNFSEILSRFYQLERVWNSKQPLSRIDVRNMLYEYFALLTRTYMQNKYNTPSSNRVLEICSYIKKNSSNNSLKISDVARHFFLSETHLRRIFTAEMKISPSEYLIKARIDNARQMLITNSGHSITEVAELCGYSSVYYFCATFKKITGLTCSEYIAKVTEDKNIF